MDGWVDKTFMPTTLKLSFYKLDDIDRSMKAAKTCVAPYSTGYCNGSNCVVLKVYPHSPRSNWNFIKSKHYLLNWERITKSKAQISYVFLRRPSILKLTIEDIISHLLGVTWCYYFLSNNSSDFSESCCHVRFPGNQWRRSTYYK